MRDFKNTLILRSIAASGRKLQCVAKDRRRVLSFWPVLRDASLRAAPQDEEIA